MNPTYGFSSSHVWIWDVDYKESWVPKNWCFWNVVLEKTQETLGTARRSDQSILKEINPEYSLEGLMLKLKLQYFSHLMWRANSEEKILMLGKTEGKRRRGWQRRKWLDRYHRLNKREFEQILGESGGRRSLVCCSPWGHEESNMT